MAYITPRDLYDDGFQKTPQSDKYLTERIAIAQELIEQLTGRFFEKRTLTIKLDGRGHDTLWLPAPPVSETALTSVKVYGFGSWEDFDLSGCYVDMSSVPDGRFNPTLVRILGVWNKGKGNISVSGDFGFVDSSVDSQQHPVYSTPRLIKDLTKRITSYYNTKVGDDAGGRQQFMIEEQLGDYRYKLSEVLMAGGIFGDPKIDNTVAMFKQRRITTV